ncbi:hypothetical protein HDU92_006827, partial [Lobulomyces angularis]
MKFFIILFSLLTNFSFSKKIGLFFASVPNLTNQQIYFSNFITTAHQGCIKYQLNYNPEIKCSLKILSTNFSSVDNEISYIKLDSTFSNLDSIIFPDEQIAFLSGMIGGLLSANQKIGVAMSFLTPERLKVFNIGVKAGVLHSCKTCFIYYSPSVSANSALLSSQEFYNKFEVDFLISDNLVPLTEPPLTQNLFLINSQQNSQTITNLKSSENYFLQGGVTKNFPLAILKLLKNEPDYKKMGISQNGFNYFGLNDLNFEAVTGLQSFDKSNGCPNINLIEKKLFISNFLNSTTIVEFSDDIFGVNVDGKPLETTVSENNTFFELSSFGSKPPKIDMHTFTLGSNNIFYLFGGFTSNGTELGLLWTFDYVNNNWLNIPSPLISPKARKSHSAVFWNSNLVVFGGINNEYYQVLCDLWFFDVEKSIWIEKIYSGKTCRYSASSTLVENSIYIFGGFDETFLLTKTLLKLDLTTLEMITMQTTGDVPMSFSNSMMSYLNNFGLVLYGGYNKQLDYYSDKLYTLDLINLKWTIQEPKGVKPLGVSSGLMIKIDEETILITGGKRSTGIVSQHVIWFSNPKKNKWSYDWDVSSWKSNLAQHAGFLFKPKDITECNYCSNKVKPMIFIFGGINVMEKSNELQFSYFGERKKPKCDIGEFLSLDDYSRDICVKCPPGSYNKIQDGICLPCPEGGYCSGGSTVDVLEGHWQDPNPISSNFTPHIYICNSGTCCKNKFCNLNDMCVDGATGSMCSVCIDSTKRIWGER